MFEYESRGPPREILANTPARPGETIFAPGNDFRPGKRRREDASAAQLRDAADHRRGDDARVGARAMSGAVR